MAGWITADGTAKRQASALESFLGGELTSTLDRLNTLSNQLAQNDGLQGRYASEFRHDILPPLADSTKRLRDSLHDLAPELYRIINHVLAAGDG
jgi:ABC-type transporter Mla subunit MlaD